MNSNMINTFVLGLLAMLLRQGILLLAGALGIGPLVQQYVTENMTQFQQMSLGLAAAVVAIGYAAYKNFTSRQKLMQALAMAGVSEKATEVLVKDKLVETPSVTTPKHVVPK